MSSEGEGGDSERRTTADEEGGCSGQCGDWTSEEPARMEGAAAAARKVQKHRG